MTIVFEKAQLSIVIPVRNGATTLGRQLDALVEAHKPCVPIEVIIADNGSTDATVEIALSFVDALPIRVVDASRGTGINVARNCGISGSMGEWILLCDADDEVDIDWLVHMAADFDLDHALLGGPIDYQRLNEPAARRWRGATFASVTVHHDFLASAHGANCGFTRKAFDAINGFDESFLGGGDDTDFFWRAQLAGFALHVVPNAVVHYRLRSTLRGLWSQSVGYGASGALLYRKFESSGLHRRGVRPVLHDVWWLASRLPFSLPIGRRGAWLRVLGGSWGKVLGSVRNRTIWL